MPRLRIDPFNDDDIDQAHNQADKEARTNKRTKRHCAKTRFSYHSQAIAAIHHLSEVSTRDSVPTRAYKCDQCNGWHLTSQPDPSPRSGELIDLATYFDNTDPGPDDDPTPPATPAPDPARVAPTLIDLDSERAA